jgi:predicted AAA+ superfamily ATPase
LIDLLSEASESRYWNHPDLLLADISARKYKWVIIDEVQKVPKLLDLVHKAIEEHKVKFILTGSSARKLKRGGANLLAGRAFLFYLFPLTHTELGPRFDINEVLSWGALPQVFKMQTDMDKKNFLVSYAKTYLREEIIAEQLVRNTDGFRGFLEIAAQMNGKSLNFSKIGRECGIDSKTVNTFFQVLEDTLMGFWLPGFHRSVRKAQKAQPKFYFFDLGVQRALEGTLESPPVPGTSTYGQYFESFLINEIFRFNSYSGKDYRLSFYQTTTGQEIDLVLSKGMNDILVEIKSNTQIDAIEVAKMNRITAGFKKSTKYYVSQDPIRSQVEGIHCLHWRDFIHELFLK